MNCGIMDECQSYIKEDQIQSARFVVNQYIEDLLKLKITKKIFFVGKHVTEFLAEKRHLVLFVKK